MKDHHKPDGSGRQEVSFDHLLTVDEVASVLRLHPVTVYRHLSDGRLPLPVIRVGRNVRVRAVDLQAMLAGAD